MGLPSAGLPIGEEVRCRQDGASSSAAFRNMALSVAHLSDSMKFAAGMLSIDHRPFSSSPHTLLARRIDPGVAQVRHLICIPLCRPRQQRNTETRCVPICAEADGARYPPVPHLGFQCLQPRKERGTGLHSKLVVCQIHTSTLNLLLMGEACHC